MKTICNLPVPEGSHIIAHVKSAKEWHLVYNCPPNDIKIFIFNLETHELTEIEHAKEVWESMNRPPESKL